MSFLEFVLMQKGRLAEAKRALEDALAIRRKTVADPNWRIAETEGWLGETLARQGESERGIRLLERASTFDQLYGRDNPRTVDARTRLDRNR